MRGLAVLYAVMRPPIPLPAQAPAAPSVIDGLVSDDALTPLADVAVSLLGRSIHVVTRENGRFRILGLAPGAYILVANRLGYSPATIRLDIAAADTERLAITLEHNAALLDTMKVAAMRPWSRLSDFQARRKAGIGQSMTAEEINRHNTPWVSELLRSFLGVQLKGSVAINARAGIMRDCPYRYFVDGVALPLPRDINAELPPITNLAGIEVFSSAASVPSQYAVNGAFCGVILIWTKDGSPTSAP